MGLIGHPSAMTEMGNHDYVWQIHPVKGLGGMTHNTKTNT